MTDNQTNPTADSGSDKARDAFNQFLDHQSKAFDASMKAVEALLPDGFKDNARVAGKEFAMSFKVLFDVAAEAMDKAGKDFEERMKTKRESTDFDADDRPSTTGPTKVKVQVE